MLKDAQVLPYWEVADSGFQSLDYGFTKADWNENCSLVFVSLVSYSQGKVNLQVSSMLLIKKYLLNTPLLPLTHPSMALSSLESEPTVALRVTWQSSLLLSQVGLNLHLPEGGAAASASMGPSGVASSVDLAGHETQPRTVACRQQHIYGFNVVCL